MKKLLSILLVSCVIISMMTIATVGTNAEDATKLEAIAEYENLLENGNFKADFRITENDKSVASTGNGYYLISEYPYEDIDYDHNYVYGYIGDADGDSDVSVLDATEIQLYCASIINISPDAYAVSDTDFDDDVSVLDATEIQLWIASLPANEYISHTLYEPYEEDPMPEDPTEAPDYDPDDDYYYTDRAEAFWELADLIYYNGYYDSDGYYYLYFDDSYYDMTLIVTYAPGDDYIDFFTMEYGDSFEMSSIIRIYYDDPVFTYICEYYPYYDYSDFNMAGEGELVDYSEYTVIIDVYSFESYLYDSVPYEAIEVVEATLSLNILFAEINLSPYMYYNVVDIFW